MFVEYLFEVSVEVYSSFTLVLLQVVLRFTYLNVICYISLMLLVSITKQVNITVVHQNALHTVFIDAG